MKFIYNVKYKVLILSTGVEDSHRASHRAKVGPGFLVKTIVQFGLSL